MSETADLPTRKDEAWRYSRVERLQGVPLDQWRTIDVAAGESFRDTLVVADGEATKPTELHRWRVTVGEGATCELFAVLASAEFARLEIEVVLKKGAHFELGGIAVGGRETVREFVTHMTMQSLKRPAIRSSEPSTGAMARAISSVGSTWCAMRKRPMRRRTSRGCCWKRARA